jgi:hypothetical protein
MDDLGYDFEIHTIISWPQGQDICLCVWVLNILFDNAVMLNYIISLVEPIVDSN